jgi:hypothetical protein
MSLALRQGITHMFTITASAEPLSITWDDDGSGADLELDFTAVGFVFTGKSGDHDAIPARVHISRETVHWLWGNLDKEIIRELARVQTEGGQSARLAEIARALGVDESDGDH